MEIKKIRELQAELESLRTRTENLNNLKLSFQKLDGNIKTKNKFNSFVTELRQKLQNIQGDSIQEKINILLSDSKKQNQVLNNFFNGNEKQKNLMKKTNNNTKTYKIKRK